MKNYAIAILATMLCACASTPKNIEAYAVLLNTKIDVNDASHSMMFESVNDRKLKVAPFVTPNQAIHYVDPGMSKLKLYVTYNTPKYRGVQVADYLINVDLKNNTTYKIVASEADGCITMELKDTQGNTVAGPITNPWYEYDSFERLLMKIGQEKYIEHPKKC